MSLLLLDSDPQNSATLGEGKEKQKAQGRYNWSNCITKPLKSYRALSCVHHTPITAAMKTTESFLLDKLFAFTYTAESFRLAASWCRGETEEEQGFAVPEQAARRGKARALTQHPGELLPSLVTSGVRIRRFITAAQLQLGKQRRSGGK